MSMQSRRRKSRGIASGLGSSQATHSWGLGEYAVPTSSSCFMLFLKHLLLAAVRDGRFVMCVLYLDRWQILRQHI